MLRAEIQLRIFNVCAVVAAIVLLLPNATIAQTEQVTVQKEQAYEVIPVHALNSKWQDFGPTAVGNKLYFSSYRSTNNILAGENNWKASAFSSVFVASVEAAASFAEASSVKIAPRGINMEDHSGPMEISQAGDEIFLTRTDAGTSRGNRIGAKPKILLSNITDGKVGKFSRLPFQNDAYSYGHANLSEDGKVLYFVSDMAGGLGGKDIYFITKENGKWSAPQNVGAPINTKGDELYPFMRKDTLYFSSNSHSGFGGLDIFSCHKSNGVWAEVSNLGLPLNSPKDDYAIYFEHGKNAGYFTSDRTGGEGLDDIYRFNVYSKFEINPDLTSQHIHGYFRYRDLRGDPIGILDVSLVDESGAIVLHQQTDESGFFSFQSIPLDKSYSVRVANNADVELVLLDSDNSPTAYLQQNETGDFVYRQLPLSRTGTMALIDERDIDFELSFGSLAGKFIYENLSLHRTKGVVIHLVDESGNIVFTTTTDELGNFEFKNLPLDGNYFLMTDNVIDRATILVFNSEDDVVAELKMDENGIFNYRSLPYQRSDLYGDAAKDISKLEMPDPKSTIFGRFFFAGMDKVPPRLKIMVYDAERRMVHTAHSDQGGNFYLTEMPSSPYYLFRISPEDFKYSEDIKLAILNSKGVEQAELVRNDDGFFVFETLKYANLGMEPMAEREMSISSLGDLSKKMRQINTSKPSEFVIYFRYNSSYITAESAGVLKHIVQRMIDSPELRLNISSYTDSRGEERYNQILSDKRAQGVLKYMQAKEVSLQRVTADGFGEYNLVNNCTDGVSCDENQHQLNRRAEFTFY